MTLVTAAEHVGNASQHRAGKAAVLLRLRL